MTSPAALTAPDRTRRTVTGLGLIVGGALLGMLAMTALPWYRGSLGGFLAFGTKVSDLRETIAFYQSAKDVYNVIDYGVSPLYFRWLALTLLLFAALLGASTIGLDGRASRVAGIAAATVGAAGVVLTGFAIQLVDVDAGRLEKATGTASNPPGYFDFVGASSIGAWAMVLGYVAICIGAVLASGGRETMRALLADEPEPADEPDPANEPGEPAAARAASEPSPREPETTRESW